MSETVYLQSDWCQRRFSEYRILIGNLQPPKYSIPHHRIPSYTDTHSLFFQFYHIKQLTTMGRSRGNSEQAKLKRRLLNERYRANVVMAERNRERN